MEKTIKQISLDDYGKLGFTFTESEIEEYGLRQKDIVDLSDLFIKESK